MRVTSLRKSIHPSASSLRLFQALQNGTVPREEFFACRGHLYAWKCAARLNAVHARCARRATGITQVGAGTEELHVSSTFQRRTLSSSMLSGPPPVPAAAAVRQRGARGRSSRQGAVQQNARGGDNLEGDGFALAGNGISCTCCARRFELCMSACPCEAFVAASSPPIGARRGRGTPCRRGGECDLCLRNRPSPM
jgi:hypothetical protein